ncbi:MAG: hypothetical protein AB7C95_00910 [Synergistaceae bacterium]
MTLKEEIQADLKEAMDGDLKEAVKAFTYTVPGDSTNYNPTTGQVSSTGTTAPGRGVVYEVNAQEIANVPFMEKVTQKAIVLQNELSLTPEVDGVLDTTDEQYIVIYVKPDPVGATWELFLGLYTPTEA